MSEDDGVKLIRRTMYADDSSLGLSSYIDRSSDLDKWFIVSQKSVAVCVWNGASKANNKTMCVREPAAAISTTANRGRLRIGDRGRIRIGDCGRLCIEDRGVHTNSRRMRSIRKIYIPISLPTLPMGRCNNRN
ncbi:hypothetical protein EVAR_16862_1 [Eumeta japonica]|uniref:Uncharacterized protein n=1 Tax=Eumeta variegata TaxID=151549 RepID=A0A4C1V2G1_EUMVA|nr:hypothetical protein EVAR_16862_1 [Eumeta japonica]